MIGESLPFDAAVSSSKPEPLIDASEVARLLGVSRWWVYSHAGELGAVRLGTGPRAAVRFLPERVAEVRASGFGSRNYQESDSRTAEPQRRPRRKTRSGSEVELLPVGAAEARARRRSS